MGLFLQEKERKKEKKEKKKKELFYAAESYQTKLFLVSFLLNNLRDELTLESYNRLYSEELGIKMLVRMPEEEQKKYKSLAGYPNLIVESLLMNKEISRVFVLMREFAELRSDNLVIRYAAKTLLFPSDIKQRQVRDWKLTGDTDHDALIRDSFYYPTVSSPFLHSPLSFPIPIFLFLFFFFFFFFFSFSTWK